MTKLSPLFIHNIADDGVVMKETAEDVVRLKTSLTVPMNTTCAQINHHIIHDLAGDIANILVKDNLLIYDTHYDPVTMGNIFNAELKVVPPDVTWEKVRIKKESFYANGVEYTEDEVLNALMETYPENFI